MKEPNPPSSSKPRCKLVGTDGNVFALAGRCKLALRKAGYIQKEQEFTSRLMKCDSYGAALRLMMEYVDVC